MKIITFTCTCLVLLLQNGVSGQGGTFFCDPCWGSNCYVTNRDTVITYAGGNGFSGGSVLCKDIADNVNGITMPDQCGAVQAITRNSVQNPCGCQQSNGDQCEDRVASSSTGCDVCSGKGSVADPNAILGQGANFPGFTCGEMTSYDDIVFTGDICERAKSDVNTFCQCGGSIISSTIDTSISSSSNPDTTSTNGDGITLDGITTIIIDTSSARRSDRMFLFGPLLIVTTILCSLPN